MNSMADHEIGTPVREGEATWKRGKPKAYPEKAMAEHFRAYDVRKTDLIALATASLDKRMTLVTRAKGRYDLRTICLNPKTWACFWAIFSLSTMVSCLLLKAWQRSATRS